MHILVVNDGFPYPLTSGRIRQYHMLGGLARRHRVTLVAAVPMDHPAEHADALAGRVHRIVTVPSLRLSRGVLRKATGRLLPRSTRDIERAIARIDGDERIDRVLNARLPVRFSEVLPGVPVVTDLCDAVPDGLRDRLRVAAPLDLPLLVAKHRDSLRSEAQMINEADEIVFASTRDEAVVARRRALPHVTIVPNGVDAAYWKRREPMLGIGTVVFAGAMPYAPNEDAALYLLADVMPRVREHRPDTRLVIAGRDPGPRLLAAAALDERVEVTGYVEDLRPQLERAAVVVAPLRFATGIQNKILEAMAMAIPVVTTPVGEAGLLIPGELAPPISVAADAVGLAAAIVGKLDAAKRDPRPDAVARGWVMERFRWDTAIDHIERLLDRARSRRG
jgi:glycosyltransferase involved in cell wall biosynthesis